MEIETEYRAIEGYDGYRVGSDGSVWSRWGGGRRSPGGAWRPMAVVLSHYGYPRVKLRGRQFLVNRLVCAAFHGPPPIPEYQAAHLDGKPANCTASNLAWKTHKENMADMLRHGTVPRGERNGYSKLTEADVRLMRAERRGRSLTAIGAEFGVSRAAVCMILSGKRWGWLK